MERAVYFDGWFPHHANYHPSLPPRRLAMLDDIAAMRGTMLVWAGLGGGVISLPYLEEEAYGPVPARYRQYGFVTDAEFLAQARRRGVDLFAIVFEAQAWSFAAELDDRGTVIAQNELRGVGRPTTVGLRAFGRDEGPSDWKPFAHYFPQPLINSLGEPVTDLWAEVASRDLDGQPLHAHWVEVDRAMGECYFADRNNPVWQAYLRRLIAVQIDAGATAIQLDETDTPMTAFRYGGCFCKDCMAEFRRYAAGLPADRLPAELHDVDLAGFDYAGWLRERGYRAGMNPQTFPLYDLYARSQQVAIARTFAELVGWAREYAAERGVQLRVGGNFYDCAPYYDPLVEQVDVFVTEMRETRYQQPWYFRHGVGLARGRAVVAVENPYGGMTAELNRQLRAGRGADRFRLTIFEASAMGANMALPYGSWLGTEERDSYWVEPALLAECGGFLAEIDPFISDQSPHTTAVVYSVATMMRPTLDSDQFNDHGRWFPPVRSAAPPVRYWEVLEELSRHDTTFDVVVLPDEELRPNDVDAERLSRYRTVVLPTVRDLGVDQHRAIVDFARSGGSVLVVGDYGIGLPAGLSAELFALPSVRRLAPDDPVAPLIHPETRTELGPLGAVSVHRLAGDGIAVHLLNYDYRSDTDAVAPRIDTVVSVAVGLRADSAVLHRPGVEPVRLDARPDGPDRVAVTVPTFATYAVITFGVEQ